MLSTTLRLMKDNMASKLNQDADADSADEDAARATHEQYEKKLQEYIFFKLFFYFSTRTLSFTTLDYPRFRTCV